MQAWKGHMYYGSLAAAASGQDLLLERHERQAWRVGWWITLRTQCT